MEDNKQFPTPAMLRAREKLTNMTPEEHEAGLKEMREEIRRHASLSLLTRRALRETDMFEKTENGCQGSLDTVAEEGLSAVDGGNKNG